MKRRPGELLPLERRILEIAAARRDEIHGFALARELDEGGRERLIGHGTLYKALDRLRDQGFLEARWEEPDAAERERRPRRRLYRITHGGRLAVTEMASGRPRAKSSAPREAT